MGAKENANNGGAVSKAQAFRPNLHAKARPIRPMTGNVLESEA